MYCKSLGKLVLDIDVRGVRGTRVPHDQLESRFLVEIHARGSLHVNRHGDRLFSERKRSTAASEDLAAAAPAGACAPPAGAGAWVRTRFSSVRGRYSSLSAGCAVLIEPVEARVGLPGRLALLRRPRLRLSPSWIWLVPCFALFSRRLSRPGHGPRRSVSPAAVPAAVSGPQESHLERSARRAPARRGDGSDLRPVRASGALADAASKIPRITNSRRPMESIPSLGTPWSMRREKRKT